TRLTRPAPARTMSNRTPPISRRSAPCMGASSGSAALISIRSVQQTERVSAMAGLVVRLQQIEPEVAVVIAPHRVNVVGVILRVVVLDEERRRLHAIVMRPAAFQGARPGEVQILSHLLDLLLARLRHLLGYVVGVLSKKRHQHG